MLIHHLFYSSRSQQLYDDIIVYGVGFVNQIGLFSKVCVSVFVFCSGYGLAVSTPEKIKLKTFFRHRFKKLYFNYWYIWLLFVPVGVIVFGRSFADAYGEHTVIKGALDFVGLLKMFGYDSYNPTWWFYNCIIVLYLIFPLLNNWLWKTPYMILSCSLFIALLGSMPVINVISSYLLVFVSGMFVAKMPLKLLDNTKIWHVLVAIGLLSIWRMMKFCPTHIAESLICVGLAMLVYKFPLDNWIGKTFEHLGKHSMNMFLTHTFIFSLWFSKYIYISRNPIIIFISLLVASYLMSVLIEWTKHIVGFNKLLV